MVEQKDWMTYEDYIQQYQIDLLQDIADELGVEYDPLPWEDQ